MQSALVQLGLFVGVQTYGARLLSASRQQKQSPLKLLKRAFGSAVSTVSGKKGKGSGKLKVLVLGSDDDMRGEKACLVMLKHMPEGAEVLAVGPNIESLKSQNKEYAEADALLVATANGDILGETLRALPKLKWIQGVFAGMDHLKCPEFTNGKYIVTNAKGIFSSSLAEWVMLSCGYWNKQIPRFNKNKADRRWDQFLVDELKGKTMGIIGYGDIGKACAKLAKAYGMKVIGVRRRPEESKDDPYIDEIKGTSTSTSTGTGTSSDPITSIMSRSDFVVVAAALTKHTEGMLQKQHFDAAKAGSVFINVGRGKLCEESALIEALQLGLSSGGEKGIAAAALDVFATEPLPLSSPIWDLENVLLSPHSADMTRGLFSEIVS